MEKFCVLTPEFHKEPQTCGTQGVGFSKPVTVDVSVFTTGKSKIFNLKRLLMYTTMYFVLNIYV